MTEECSIVAAEELKRMPMVTTMIRNPGRPCCFNETRTTALPLAKMATGTARFTKKFFRLRLQYYPGRVHSI
jgi:hypothetical protein